ncbi:MAG: tripartite tricarboxylate transporter substrate binding protein [Proteobacteria bacterium]|nr:tripartite tricarboxylate transporter substrate binding protein [Burkholderiales bacterium]
MNSILNLCIALFVGGALGTGGADAATSESYPSRALRMIVAAAPGGANDVLGRLYAARMTESLGQPVIVDNRAGGGGIIGAELVAQAAPDGYTLLYSTNSVVVNPSLTRVGYSMKQLAPLSLVTSFPIAISVHPSVPAKSIPELVALSKQRGGMNFGSSGTGSTNHLTGVLFNNVAGLKNVHIPYKGAGPMMAALQGGEIEIGVSTVFSVIQAARANRARVLAVTSREPLASLPGVPPMAKFYPGFYTDIWHGYFTTAGTPPAVIARLHGELVKALRSPEVQRALDDGGAQSIGSSPTEFAAVLVEDFKRYAALVKSSGAKAE